MPEPTELAYRFRTSQAAWDFMRAADASGVGAGFPSLDGTNTVRCRDAHMLAYIAAKHGGTMVRVPLSC